VPLNDEIISDLRDSIYSSAEDGNEDIFGRCSQWTSDDGSIFYPAATSVKELPAGVYTIGLNFGQIYFEKVIIKTEDLIRFTDANSDKVIEEINSFWQKKDIFSQYNLPYKRGILLFGPPGSGKTCTIRFLVNDLIALGGIVIQVDDISVFAAGLEILRKIEKNKPIIAIIEDIDHYRGNEERSLLSILDGIVNVENIVFLATTNFPEELTDRILNRPSRFDKRFYIGYPNATSRKQYLLHLASLGNKAPFDKKTLKKIVNDTQGLSVAHLKELFVATIILDNSYELAIKTIREMKNQLSSKDFDKYEEELGEVFDDERVD